MSTTGSRETPKVTVRAGSNIAFIKYWGVLDAEINIPLSNSISMTLADAYTTTTVQWLPESALASDEITLDGKLLDTAAAERLVRHLDRLRALAGVGHRARIASANNFPMASGIASSASGFAALTVAGCAALEMDLDATRLSAIARRGSGSASRSLFGGFVEWEQGDDDATSVARQLAPAAHWPLVDIVAVVSSAAKSVSSERGHTFATDSPLNAGRIAGLACSLGEVRDAIAQRDIRLLGPIIERDALAMHAVMMTGTYSLLYWQPGTIEVMHAARRWRSEDHLPVYFTIDAGPNVHLICEADHADAVVARLHDEVQSLEQVIVSRPGPGPVFLDEHLF
ncbi:MAG: diphosphomevalonate decarboxylase [Caldilineaceae bacterium]